MTIWKLEKEDLIELCRKQLPDREFENRLIDIVDNIIDSPPDVVEVVQEAETETIIQERLGDIVGYMQDYNEGDRTELIRQILDQLVFLPVTRKQAKKMTDIVNVNETKKNYMNEQLQAVIGQVVDWPCFACFPPKVAEKRGFSGYVIHEHTLAEFKKTFPDSF